jgi:hypothetical protein
MDAKWMYATIKLHSGKDISFFADKFFVDLVVYIQYFNEICPKIAPLSN